MAETFWNGQPCEARKVRVIVGPAPVKTWWCAGLEGAEREAVEVVYAGQSPFYMDNEDGSGWQKVTIGRGKPNWYHASLPVAALIDDTRAHRFTCNRPGIIGADNCQATVTRNGQREVCGRFSDDPETATFRDEIPEGRA